MAKFGYRCQCGWHLTRSTLTRKQYANAKMTHAVGQEGFTDKNGNEVPAVPGCEFLHEELKATWSAARSGLMPARIK